MKVKKPLRATFGKLRATFENMKIKRVIDGLNGLMVYLKDQSVEPPKDILNVLDRAVELLSGMQYRSKLSNKKGHE